MAKVIIFQGRVKTLSHMLHPDSGGDFRIISASATSSHGTITFISLALKFSPSRINFVFDMSSVY